MSRVTKRPADEFTEASSKRTKTDLPAGFFDSDKSNPTVTTNKGSDDEWARFQEELGESHTDKTNKAMTSTKSRLTILGLDAGEGTIVADAMLTKTSKNETANSGLNSGGARGNDKAITEETDTSNSGNKKSDIDAYIEEDAAEGLLEELETQKELYDRVLKMKNLQSQVKHKLLSVQKEKTHINDKIQPSNEQLEDENIDTIHSSLVSDEEDENDDESDSLWRKRTL